MNSEPYWPTYVSNGPSGPVSYAYLDGMAGILSVLWNSYVLLKSLNLNNTINNAKSYILTQTNLGSLGPGYFTGTGGLCNVLNQIPKMNYPLTPLDHIPLSQRLDCRWNILNLIISQ